jgi:hypothetical protein
MKHLLDSSVHLQAASNKLQQKSLRPVMLTCDSLAELLNTHTEAVATRHDATRRLLNVTDLCRMCCAVLCVQCATPASLCHGR